MYDNSDPRAMMNRRANKSKAQPVEFADVKHVKMYALPPQESTLGTKTWWMRGQNFYLAYSEAVDGETFERNGQKDEYVALLPDQDSEAVITWKGQEHRVQGYSLVVIPGGRSQLTMAKGGRLVRLFSIHNDDLQELPINKADYVHPDPNVTPFEPWPESVDGSAVRVYSLNVPVEEGRFGRIFRCSTFMVNVLYPYDGPRDPSKLSPHAHEDFEQCSLVLEGEFIHHLRWPWTPDKTKWRPDNHEHCGAPSVTIMPAGVIHTSEAVGAGQNWLVDIFCPPRLDFSKQPGWVLNEKDYPLLAEDNE